MPRIDFERSRFFVNAYGDIFYYTPDEEPRTRVRGHSRSEAMEDLRRAKQHWYDDHNLEYCCALHQNSQEEYPMEKSWVKERYRDAARRAEDLFQDAEELLSERHSRRNNREPPLSPSNPFTSAKIPLNVNDYEQETGYSVYSLYCSSGKRFGSFTGAEGHVFKARYPGENRLHPSEVAEMRRYDEELAKARKERLEKERKDAEVKLAKEQAEAAAAEKKRLEEEVKAQEARERQSWGIRAKKNKLFGKTVLACENARKGPGGWVYSVVVCNLRK